MLKTFFITLMGFWSLCLIEGIGGRMIHLLLVMAMIVLVYRLFGMRRAVD